MNIKLDEVIASDIKTYIECFDLITDDDGISFYLCCLEGCTNKYATKSGAIRHLSRNHKEIHEAIKAEKVKREATSSPSFEIRVRVNPNDILDAC